MKAPCFSAALIFLGAGLALAGNSPRAEAPQGLRQLPGAQGVVANADGTTAAPELKPIPGSAVQVSSLQPLLPVATSANGVTSLLLASSTAQLTTASATSAALALETGLSATPVSLASHNGKIIP